MRVWFVLVLVLIGALYSWKGPFHALLFYLWIAYFRPDWWIGYYALIWQLNISYIVGVFVLASSVLTGQKFRFGFGALLILLFLLQSFLSVELSPYYDYSFVSWRKFAPSVIFGYMLIVLVTDEKRLRQVLLVIAASLSFEGAKQGWLQFFINPGGQNFNTHAMLGDNNGVAVGMFMLVPILVTLARTASTKSERWLHRFLSFGVTYRAVTTYSRGGFLACGALALHYLLRSKRKLATVVTMALVILLIAPVLPDAFWNRMQTIQVAPNRLDDQETDASIRSRVHFWRVALIMADDVPLTGVGFNAFTQAYDRYDFSNGQYGQRREVHNVWLATLAETGVLGFTTFILLFVVSLLACRRARRLAKWRPDCQNLAVYATTIEAMLIVCAVGSTFVTFHTEFLWHTFSLAVVVNNLAIERMKAPVPETSRVKGPKLLTPKSVPAVAAMTPARIGNI